MTSSSDSKTNSTENLTSLKLPRQKLNAIARLRQFGESLIPRRPPPTVFPPPSWELDDEALGEAAARSRPALAESNFEETPCVEPPEALTFAQRLRSLIDSLPIPGSTTSNSNTTSATVPSGDNDKHPVSPIPEGMDEELVKMLSSEEVMNGKIPSTPTNATATEGADAGAKSRPSIWNVLSGLGSRTNPSKQTALPSPVEEDEQGLMLYAPLEPKADSELQLAESETVLEYVDEPESSTSKDLASGKSRSTETLPPSPTQKHVWVPSTTELSIMTTWWGYRIYLPPPVMTKLGGRTLKASARAAMITTALKWLLDKIPMMLIPVQFRPAVKMLKTLSPLVSYIGVFIAWSWDRIRSLDEGNGVVLTATWLLPVALLPMSWDAGDIYGPKLAPPPEEMGNTGEDDKKKGQASNSKRSIFRW